MVFQHIEKLKREYTDKYVVVDDSRPELLRFKNQTGLVRTVIMSGRALVEFDAFENIGWYDIDVDFLKIVDKPLPKEEPAKKPAAKKPAAKPADAKPAAGGKMSAAEMMAAARAEKSSGDAAPKIAKKPSAEKQAEPKSDGAKAADKLSVAEMLAAARAEKDEAAAVATEPEPVAEPNPPAEEEPASAPAAPSDIPTDLPGILAYCRKVDG